MSFTDPGMDGLEGKQLLTLNLILDTLRNIRNNERNHSGNHKDEMLYRRRVGEGEGERERETEDNIILYWYPLRNISKQDIKFLLKV